MSKPGGPIIGLFVALVVAGCSDPGALAALGGLPPDPSVLEQADPPITTPSTSCANGYRLTFIPRGVGSAAPSVRTSAGVWHTLYPVLYSSGGHMFFGLRHVSSDDLAHAHSIGWLSKDNFTFVIGIGPDDVPTAIYPSWVGPGAPNALTRARFINGAWQVDATPFWTTQDSLAQVQLSVPLVIDRNNHAHVAVGSNLISDVSGAWVATSVTGVAPQQDSPQIVALAVDAAGHDYVNVKSATGSVLASNVSGPLATIAGADAAHDNQFLRTDAAGHVHGFGIDTGYVVATDLTAMYARVLVGMTGDPSMVADFGTLDAAGNPVLYAFSQYHSLFSFLSVVNGALQSQPFTFLPMGGGMPDSMVSDGSGATHFTVHGVGSQGALVGYLDPC